MLTAGIDIGTTTICGTLLDTETGRQVKAVTRPNPSRIAAGRDWEALQDPDRILCTAREILDGLSENAPPFEAVGVTGQMHGILYTDAGGEAVSPLFTWQDGRGRLPRQGGESYSDFLSAQSGMRIPSGYGLCTHFYNLENGLVPARAEKLCTIGDYVAMKLAGRVSPCMDVTNAASLGLFDVRSGTFCTDILKGLGIPVSILPALSPSGAVIGEDAVSGKAPVPVACACGDNQASFMGAVGNPETAVSVNIGTGSQLSVYSAAYREASGMETRPFFGRGYLLVGASINGGKAYASLAGFFREACRLFMGDIPREDALYQAMEQAARAVAEDENSLSVSASLYGTREDPAGRGSVANLNSRNFTPGHLTDAFLNASAEDLCAYWEMLDSTLRAEKKELVFSGNGARKNPLLREKTAARCGLSQTVSPVEEEAACGAARLASLICGGRRKKGAETN